MNRSENTFIEFLNNFVPRLADKEKELNLAWWELSTTSSKDAEQRYAQNLADLKRIFADRVIYRNLLQLKETREIQDEILSRQLDDLIMSFKGNMLPPELIEEMSFKEAQLEATFGNFRPELNGVTITDNDLKDILGRENDVELRKAAWAASKQVGLVMAPLLMEMVKLRNQAAQILGYPNFFIMEYELQELDADFVLGFFDILSSRSLNIINNLQGEIRAKLSRRFNVPESDIGPWAWPEPFCQDDPISDHTVDELFKDYDVISAVKKFYESIGINVSGIFANSDFYERSGKNPHAFCISIDRKMDIRILANVKPNFHWFSTMMHETGHGVYDMYIDQGLPLLLREPAHILTTEAMAILAEYYASQAATVRVLFGLDDEAERLMGSLSDSYRREQIIFAGWTNVVVRFEKHLYENPDQDLQSLWWMLVERYQGVSCPAGREKFTDWASKMHINTAPCYYQNYLLGHVLASQIRARLREITGTDSVLGKKEAGKFLKEKFFAPGNRYPWNKLVQNVTGHSLEPDAWILEIQK